MRTIAIIGAGFSGTATAVHLLKLARAPVRILLLDDHPELASGLAYSADHQGLSPQRARRPDVAGRLAAKRARRLQRAAGRADGRTRLHIAGPLRPLPPSASLQDAIESSGLVCARIWGRAKGLTQLHNRAHFWRIDLDDGHLLFADEEVLALGHPLLARVSALEPILAKRGYVRDPWSSWPQERPEKAPRRVLLLGTGLTMADVALRLALRGPEPPEILALSRHGRLPQPQAVFNRTTLPGNAIATIRASSGSIRELVRVVRALSHEVTDAGGDWREVITTCGPSHPLWPRLNSREAAIPATRAPYMGRPPPPTAASSPRRSSNNCRMRKAPRPRGRLVSEISRVPRSSILAHTR